MKCPVCKTNDLKAQNLHNGLQGFTCDDCNGSWIRFEDYDSWRKITQDNPAQEELCEYSPESDTKKALLCPDCGRILIKYSVSKDIPFLVDNCSYCNGVWLNRTEWDVLIKNNLHKQMTSFFTEPWQKKLQKEITRSKLEYHYRKLFNEDYDKIMEIRSWIHNTTQKEKILMFLSAGDQFTD